jgi:hypothetical protein
VISRPPYHLEHHTGHSGDRWTWLGTKAAITTVEAALARASEELQLIDTGGIRVVDNEGTVLRTMWVSAEKPAHFRPHGSQRSHRFAWDSKGGLRRG